MRRTTKEYIGNNRAALILFGIIWVALLVVAVTYDKVEGHIMLNSVHNSALDLLFKGVTLLGTMIPLGIGVGVVLFNIRKGCYIILAQVFAFIITQPFKFLFAHKRPAALFNDLNIEIPNAVDGIELHTAHNSFPSGHTSAAFAFFFCLVAITPAKYRWVQFICVIVAWLVGYSRVYLSQHFLEDVLFGSIIGVVAAVIAYSCLYRKSWGERPLFKGCSLSRR